MAPPACFLHREPSRGAAPAPGAWERKLTRPAVAIAMALLTVGCSRGPGPVHVVAVKVASEGLGGPLAEAGLDEDALGAAAREGLEKAGFAVGRGGRPYRAEVSIASIRLAPPDASGAGPRIEVSVEIELSPASPGVGAAVRETGTAASALAGSDPRRAGRSALAEAARRAARGLALAFAEEAKTLEQVIADLGSKDPSVRDHAVRVLADRRSNEAVPALIERLKDADPTVAHRAVGALAQIGDERAIEPLIELSRSGDPMLAARVARLIGDIGGAEAEGYLLTIEAGHPDPRVRRAARDALQEMRAAAAGPAPLSARK